MRATAMIAVVPRFNAIICTRRNDIFGGSIRNASGLDSDVFWGAHGFGATGTSTSWSNASLLAPSPRPVCLRTRSQV